MTPDFIYKIFQIHDDVNVAVFKKKYWPNTDRVWNKNNKIFTSIENQRLSDMDSTLFAVMIPAILRNIYDKD